VRTCEPTYAKANIERAGIKFHDMECADGQPPPDAVITEWLEACTERFGDLEEAGNAKPLPASSKAPSIAVHCIAGLGRAPVLVCIALIEAGLPSGAAIELVRRKRTRALNRAQIKFLTTTYKRRSGQGSCCIVS